MQFLIPVETEKAPAAIGPYSQAICYGDLVFSSGQIPLDVAGELVSHDIAEQTRQVLKNLQAVLEAADSDISHVIKTTVFLADMQDFAAMNAVYEEHFSAPHPARSTIQAAGLPRNVRVEIEAVAKRKA